MSATEGLRLESVVEYILRVADVSYRAEYPLAFGPEPPKPGAGTHLIDFLAEWKGQRIAIEAMGGRLFPARMKRFLQVEAGLSATPLVDALLLVVEAPLSKGLSDWLATEMGPATIAKVLSVDELPGYFGKALRVDIHDARQVEALRIAAFSPAADTGSEDRLESAMQESSRVDPHRLQLRNLKRLFPAAVVDRLDAQPGSLEEKLRIGTTVRGVTVLLSDIMNFSSFVKHAPTDLLNEAMSEYYRAARRVVWNHGGTLDKFIGDAVLAIFGYPEDDGLSARRAARAARDLIVLGDQIISGLMENINDVIESGTRVGLASGDVRVMNLSEDGLEPSFVGDVINRAARLEKNSPVNCILIDQVTYRCLMNDSAEPTDFPREDRMECGIVEKGEAKGQAWDQWTWTIDCEAPPPHCDLIARLRAGRRAGEAVPRPTPPAEAPKPPAPALAEAAAGPPPRGRRGR
ncbi:MAG TPA: adenylate/guanylate cyclase domain-containing protein [Azospirillaceae bacterium]|nr:adenylate/guanylate cyclase domain-containing protein [Azospirillaceae bacterium]